MSRKVVFLWGPVATLALVVGALGLLRVYLAEATELLMAELTGAGAQIERIDVGYLPPSVTLHNLRFETGSDRFEAPRVDLYPDFSKLMDGEVSLDRAVLDRPLIRAAASGGSGSGFDPALLPKSMSIRNASFIVDENGIPTSPVTFSADLEKEEVGVGIAVKSASIPEFGLTFSGTVDVRSMAPLNLTVDASKGTFDPSRLLDFLRRFEYLDATDLAMFAGVRQILAEEFRLDFDGAAGSTAFTARTFVFDGNQLSEFAVSANAKGGWAVACKNGSLDAAQVMALIKAHPDGGEVFIEALHGLGLDSLAADGSVNLTDVKVQSRGGTAKPTGVLSLASPSLKLSLVSLKGETQDVTLTNFDGAVTLKNGKPMVSVKRLDLTSSAGGNGGLTGELPIPFVLAGTRFQAEARQLDWFGTILDGDISKKDGRQIDFDVTVRNGETLLAAKGLARNEFSGANRWAAVFEDLVVQTPRREDDADAEPFDFGFVRDGGLSGKIVARRLQYNGLPVVRDLSARVASAKGRMVVKGRGRLCLMKVGLEMALTPDSLAANIAVTGNGVHLPGVLGCFVDELPVYLRGRLTVQANFFMQGKNGRELSESVRGDVAARLRNVRVLKMSNLDKRLGFFIEIMNAAGLDPDEGDTLTFRDGRVVASMAGDIVALKAVRFGGGKVSVAGNGNFGLNDKRLRLNAHVATRFGVNKDMSIDMILSEEKSS